MRLHKNNITITKTINIATATTTAIAIIVPLESPSLRVTSLGGLEPVDDDVVGFVMKVPVGMTSDVVCLVGDVFGPTVATAVGLVGSMCEIYYLTFCRVHSNRVKCWQISEQISFSAQYFITPV